MCGHNAEAAAALQRRGDARLMVHGFVQNMDEIMQAPLSPPPVPTVPHTRPPTVGGRACGPCLSIDLMQAPCPLLPLNWTAELLFPEGRGVSD